MKGVDVVSKLAFNNDDFETKYNKYSNIIFRTAYQYLLNTDAAEDIVQETFVKLFTNKKAFNDAEHEKAWLIRVTINLCKNFLVSKTSTELELNEGIVKSDSSFEEKSEQQIDMERQLNKLTPEQRACIYLYYYEGYKIKEISDILNLNGNTVKSILSRARQTLKSNINKENHNELQ